MIRLLGLFMIIGVSGCGLDGAPIRPEPEDKTAQSTSPGITISGDARIGVESRR